MKTKKLFAFLLLIAFQITVIAQEKKEFILNNNDENIIMTWNKNTPESEMKEDIKALSEKGITIKYSKIKRNSKNEITALKIEYSDRQGNKGTMELDNQKPINTIQFFKQDGEIGFGQPSNGNDMFAGNDFFQSFNGTEMMKQFKLNENDDESQSFKFNVPKNFSYGNLQSITIQKTGKKPLVIQNGDIIEGGDDYTKEELDTILKENKVEQFNFGGSNNNQKEFDFRSQEGLDSFKQQMQKMQSEVEKLKPGSKDSDFDKTKTEMLKAKDELIKAREEIEKAKKELEKAKSSLKTQKM